MLAKQSNERLLQLKSAGAPMGIRDLQAHRRSAGLAVRDSLRASQRCDKRSLGPRVQSGCMESISGRDLGEAAAQGTVDADVTGMP